MLDNCDDFLRDDLGQIVLRLSLQELSLRAGNAVTPLGLAWAAGDYLRDSPLAYTRKSKIEDPSYAEIKRACGSLLKDFSAWSR